MDLRQIKKVHEKSLLKKSRVVAVGIGYKTIGGKQTDEQCIVVAVTKKAPKDKLKKQDLVPSKIGDAKTDVIQLGIVRAQADEDIDPTQKMRPMRPGISIAHQDSTAGTFGCVVKKEGVPYILSNNHVLNHPNNLTIGTIGDSIIQPGPYDGGTEKVAELTDFVPIRFEGEETPEPPEEPTPPPPGGGDGGSSCPIAKIFTKTANFIAEKLGRKTRLQAVVPTQAVDNTVDCAIAKPVVSILDTILVIGKPTGTNVAHLNETLYKYGRTTKYTQGEVLMIDATVSVDYGGKIATFVNQIVTTNMSQGGDSGSVVVNAGKEIVGLLFAGSNTATILNPIDDVFSKLGVTL